MTNSPIEFMGEGPAHTVPETELSGVDGLIQPERTDGRFAGSPESKGGHNDDALTPPELDGMIVRGGSIVGSWREQTTGVADTEAVIDPVSGREVPADRIEDGLSAKLSDMKP